MFWRHSQDVCTLIPDNSEYLICLSFYQLAYFLTEFRPLQGFLLFWMRYLSEMFLRQSQDVCTLVQNNFEFLVCMSVCQLAHFLTEIRSMQIYLQFWMRYLSEIFWRHSQDIGTLVPNNSEFFVCLSVSQLAYFLIEIIQIQGYLKFQMICLLEIFRRHSWDIGTLVQNDCEFVVCVSVSSCR